MSRLIESIKLLDGKFYNLFYHEQRMMRSLRLLYRLHGVVDLARYLDGVEYPREGLYKCRIVYDDLSTQVAFTRYEPLSIQRVKIVEDDVIAYDFKFSDRSAINRLFNQRGDCDDVLIVRRGMVTDCSFSNILFRKGEEWFTPHAPLLNGTMRQKLVDENKIHLREIPVDAIRSFDTYKIINAMLEFDSPEIEVSAIVF